MRGEGFIAGTKAWTAIYIAMMTTTGTSGRDAINVPSNCVGLGPVKTLASAIDAPTVR